MRNFFKSGAGRRVSAHCRPRACGKLRRVKTTRPPYTRFRQSHPCQAAPPLVNQPAAADATGRVAYSAVGENLRGVFELPTRHMAPGIPPVPQEIFAPSSAGPAAAEAAISLMPPALPVYSTISPFVPMSISEGRLCLVICETYTPPVISLRCRPRPTENRHLRHRQPKEAPSKSRRSVKAG